MYYDPMISKLITWGPDRKQAMDLLDTAFDEYVVQGVAHNLGFGKSILHNEAFAKGDYSTAFIPTYYPDGYRGDVLNKDQRKVIALAAHQLKNIFQGYNQAGAKAERVIYVTVNGQTADEADDDWRVERCLSDPSKFTITNLTSGETTELDLASFAYEHNSLIKLEGSGKMGRQTFQLLSSENDIKFNFYFQGGMVETRVYNESQFKYKQHMAPVVKIDTTRSILSPMPGAVVSVSVVPGQAVVDGQELCTIEAMKMQNILKSEREGVIKSVSVKAGDSVAVDELLIEFE